MAVTKIEHPSAEERKALGKKSREKTPPSSHYGLEAGGGPPGSGRVARGAEPHP